MGSLLNKLLQVANKGYLLVFIFALSIQNCISPSHTRQPPPDTLRIEAQRFLKINKYRLMKAVDTIQAYQFHYPIIYTNLGRMGGTTIFNNINGHYVNVTNDYVELKEFLYKNFEFGLDNVDIEADSVVVRFSTIGGIVDDVIYSICYSDYPLEYLQKYKYGFNVYSQNEEPKTQNSYFWEIETNWYVFEPKFYYETDTISGIKKTYQWANDNKERFFIRICDTLEMIVQEFDRVELENNSNVIEFEGLWSVHNNKRMYDLYTKTTLLDSLFTDIHYHLFTFDYTHKFIRVNLWSNDYLKYYYTKLPQDSLQQLIHKKIHKLKDNWYYEDF